MRNLRILFLFVSLSINCGISNRDEFKPRVPADLTPEFKKAAEAFLVKPQVANGDQKYNEGLVKGVVGVSPTKVDENTFIVDVDVVRYSGESDIVRIVCRQYSDGQRKYWKADDCPRRPDMPRPCNLPIAVESPSLAK